jgi:hypothetical protein
MENIQTLVASMFEKEQLIHALEKESKVSNAHYHHLVLQNPDRVFSDDEVVMIQKVYSKLQSIKKQQQELQLQILSIKETLKGYVAPLEGGRWKHRTNDPMHPYIEFWLEDEDLCYARLNQREWNLVN